MAKEKDSENQTIPFDWYSKFGWKDVPFEDKITPHTELIAGYKTEREEIEKWIVQQKRFGLIRGVFGTGKSTLRLWTTNYLQTKGKKFAIVNPIYALEDLNVNSFKERILKPILSPISVLRLTRNYKKLHEDKIKDLLVRHTPKNKRMYVLIDEIQDIPEETFSLIRNLSSAEAPISFLMCLPTNVYKNIKGSLVDRDKLNLLLSKMTYDEMKEMIAKRIQFYGGDGIKPFTDEMLKRIYGESEGRPRLILDMCNNYALDLALKGEVEYSKHKIEKSATESEASDEEEPASAETDNENSSPEKQEESVIEKKEDEFDKRYRQLTESERNIAEFIAGKKSTFFQEIKDHTKISDITIKVSLRRLQGMDKDYMKKKQDAPLPLIIGEGSTRNKQYMIIDKYKPYFGKS